MYFTPRASNERWNKQEIKNSNCIRIKEMIKDCKSNIIFWKEILEKTGVENTKTYSKSEILLNEEKIIALEQELKKY